MGKTFVIAEAGVNHNGDFELAKKLILAAKDAKADVVKFQTFKAESLVTGYSKKAAYQLRTTIGEETQFGMLKKLEMSYENQEKLFKFGAEVGITVISSAFDLESIRFLQKMNQEIYKIPSGEITNYQYLKSIAHINKPSILSTGMSSLGEIEAALQLLEQEGLSRDKITVLQCNTEYPTPPEDVNLRAMQSIGQALGVKVGYSDHTVGIDISLAAVALGATIIEKHFTLDRKMDGPDHSASLEPQELGQMILSIRNIEKALGDGIKRPSTSEEKNKVIVRKSLVAVRAIQKGETLTEDMVTAKRPGGGLDPMNLPQILGRLASRHYEIDEQIEF